MHFIMASIALTKLVSGKHLASLFFINLLLSLFTTNIGVVHQSDPFSVGNTGTKSKAMRAFGWSSTDDWRPARFGLAEMVNYGLTVSQQTDSYIPWH